MAEPRKVFRIEETAALRLEPQVGDSQAPQLAEVVRELSALRAMLADAPPGKAAEADAAGRDEVQRLMAELRLIHSAISGAEEPRAGGNGSRSPAASTARMAGELVAVMAASEHATQKILAAAEDIDQAANNLSAALKNEIEQGLAQDIRDRVIQIFEACNYQDLTSQRVAKVKATLDGIQRQIARSLGELARDDAAPPAQGPRLPNDNGHVSQSDVDSMFAAELRSA
jgi:chemotaxis protein CheZ